MIKKSTKHFFQNKFLFFREDKGIQIFCKDLILKCCCFGSCCFNIKQNKQTKEKYHVKAIPLRDKSLRKFNFN